MKIGLALGGGGVLGVAHLALLEELEKNNIEVSFIAGTSAGALIGGLYASGGIERIHYFVGMVREKKLLTHKSIITVGKPENLFNKLAEVLESIMGGASFEEAKKELQIVAADIDLGKQYVFDQGLIVPAILASSAYPGVFVHQEVNGRRLVDGGIINNLPTDIARKMGAEFVIASSLHQIPVISQAQKYNRATAAARALSIMQLELEKIQLAEADFGFLPPIEEFNWYNYDKFEEIYQRSKDHAKKVLPDLLAMLSGKNPISFLGKIFSAD